MWAVEVHVAQLGSLRGSHLKAGKGAEKSFRDEVVMPKRKTRRGLRRGIPRVRGLHPRTADSAAPNSGISRMVRKRIRFAEFHRLRSKRFERRLLRAIDGWLLRVGLDPVCDCTGHCPYDHHRRVLYEVPALYWDFLDRWRALRARVFSVDPVLADALYAHRWEAYLEQRYGVTVAKKMDSGRYQVAGGARSDLLELANRVRPPSRNRSTSGKRPTGAQSRRPRWCWFCECHRNSSLCWTCGRPTR